MACAWNSTKESATLRRIQGVIARADICVVSERWMEILDLHGWGCDVARD